MYLLLRNGHVPFRHVSFSGVQLFRSDIFDKNQDKPPSFWDRQSPFFKPFTKLGHSGSVHTGLQGSYPTFQGKQLSWKKVLCSRKQFQGFFFQMYCLEPETSVYKWLFQLDDSKSLYRKWLFHQTSI